MAQTSSTGDQQEDDAAKNGNTFSNDGSFMEQFMKMQKEKSETETKSETSTKNTTNISMKLPPIKRLAPASLVQKRIKSVAAKKGLLTSVKTEKKEERGETEDKKNTEPSATPSSTMTGVQSNSSSSITNTPPTTITTQSPVIPTTKGRKRKSKWDVGVTTVNTDSQAIHEAIGSFDAVPTTSVMSSGQQLTATQLEQINEQITMQKMVAEIKTATQQTQSSIKKNHYEYDSDEDTEEGTWEHKTRNKEMKLTEVKAKELTEMAKGKHHIGDFLPPQELEKFVETVKAVKEDRPPDLSDYKEHKLTEDNIGFKLLQKSGWDEGTGLGVQKQGITAPVNKGKQSFDQAGLGADKPAEVKKADSEYELYRKRMMLAYRFRPNPLNNPRRSYY